MGEIKSAWEIAMERVKEVESDPKGLRERELKDEGRRLAASLFDPLEDHLSDVKKARSRFKGEDHQLVMDGIAEVCKSYVKLPTTEADSEAAMRAIKRAGELAGVDPSPLTEQLTQIFGQYISQREELAQQLQARFADRLKRNEEQLARQTGRRVRLDPNQDPEYGKALQANMQALSDRYAGIVDQVRDEIDAMLRRT